MTSNLTRIVTWGAIVAGVTTGAVTPTCAAPLPASSAEQIAGGKLTEQVYWYGLSLIHI